MCFCVLMLCAVSYGYVLPNVIFPTNWFCLNAFTIFKLNSPIYSWRNIYFIVHSEPKLDRKLFKIASIFLFFFLVIS